MHRIVIEEVRIRQIKMKSLIIFSIVSIFIIIGIVVILTVISVGSNRNWKKEDEEQEKALSRMNNKGEL